MRPRRDKPAGSDRATGAIFQLAELWAKGVRSVALDSFCEVARVGPALLSGRAGPSMFKLSFADLWLYKSLPNF